ncbi:hypothetical protein MRX96_041420 [Rhipicephalus microplus]
MSVRYSGDEAVEPLGRAATMAAHAGPPGFDEEADNWEAYRLRLEAYFEVHDVTDEKKRRAISVTALSTKTKTTLQLTCFLGQLPVKGQLNISVTYGGTTLDATLVVLGCSGPDLCGRDVIKALEQHGRQVLAVGMKAASDTEHPGTTRQVGDSVWYRNYGTGASRKAGVLQTPEGHRMVTIKATDGEHHRRHYD